MLFPTFYEKLNCEFENLRADGAFLVSSSFKDGAIKETHIFSEKGGELKFSLPDGEYSVYINGVFKKRKKKPRLSFTQARAITSELFRFETEDL